MSHRARLDNRHPSTPSISHRSAARLSRTDRPTQPGAHPMNTTEHDESKDRKPPTTSTKEGTFELELTPSTFREWVRDEPGARFRPEAGRYHLYVMYGCPWAHRTLIVRALKGLERAIDITAVHHHLDEQAGWTFSPDEPEPLYGLRRLRELYAMADPDVQPAASPCPCSGTRASGRSSTTNRPRSSAC